MWAYKYFSNKLIPKAPSVLTYVKLYHQYASYLSKLNNLYSVSTKVKKARIREIEKYKFISISKR